MENRNSPVPSASINFKVSLIFVRASLGAVDFDAVRVQKLQVILRYVVSKYSKPNIVSKVWLDGVMYNIPINVESALKSDRSSCCISVCPLPT